MFLFEILLPISLDPTKRSGSKKLLSAVERKLTHEFGGVTSYTQSPAHGLWKDESSEIEHDTIVIVETMSSKRHKHWWKKYRQLLEKKFKQKKIVVRFYRIDMV